MLHKDTGDVACNLQQIMVAGAPSLAQAMQAPAGREAVSQRVQDLK